MLFRNFTQFDSVVLVAIAAVVGLGGCRSSTHSSTNADVEAVSAVNSSGGSMTAQQFFANLPVTFACTASGKAPYGEKSVNVQQTFTRESLVAKAKLFTNIDGGSSFPQYFIYYPNTFSWYPQWQFTVAADHKTLKDVEYNYDNAIDVIHRIPVTCSAGVKGSAQ